MTNTYKKGFTIIELMIVVSIVAVLVALALPSFRDVIRKSRRADAMNAIVDIQLSQERWRINHSTYTSNLTAAPPTGLGIDATSAEGHYGLAISGNTFGSYTITATPVSGTDQAKDKCGTFTLTNTNGTIAKTVSGTEAANRCWTK